MTITVNKPPTLEKNAIVTDKTFNVLVNTVNFISD